MHTAPHALPSASQHHVQHCPGPTRHIDPKCCPSCLTESYMQVVPRNPVSQTEEERASVAGGSAALSEPSITRLAAHSAGSTLAVVASTPDASGAGAATCPSDCWSKSMWPARC